MRRTLAERLAAGSLLLLATCTLGSACAGVSNDATPPATAGASAGGAAFATAGSATAADGGNEASAGESGAAGAAGAGDAGSGGQAGDDAGAAGTSGTTEGGRPADATGGRLGPEGGTGGMGGRNGSACTVESRVIAHSDKAWALALDSGYAYWTTRDQHGKIMRAPIAGGAAETISSDERYPHAIAAAGGHVFWVALGKEPGHVFQASVTGADRQQLSIGTFSGVFSLNVDDSYVYYVTDRNGIGRVPIGGGAVKKLGAGSYNTSVVDMVLDGSTLYFTNNGVSTFVTSEPETAGVVSLDTGGVSAPISLVSRLDYPQFEIAVDRNQVYWNDESAIYRTAKIGGEFKVVTPLPAAAPDESPIVDLASDGVYLFYSDGRAVYRVPTVGGTPELLSDGWSRIMKLALDEDSIYFTDYVSGVVVKLAKCASAVHPGDLGIASLDAPPSEPGPAAQQSAPTEPTDSSCDPASSLHGCPEVTVVAAAAQAYGLAVDHDYVYFSTFQASGSVKRVPVAGGDAVPFMTGESYPHDIALDDNQVFWCLGNTAPGYLATAPKSGGTRVQLATGIANGLGRVTSDGTFAYYVTAFNSVYRVAVGGGTVSVVASGPYNSNVNDVAFYGGELFFANDGLWKSDYSAKIPGTAYLGRTAVSGSSNLGHTAIKTALSSPLDRLAVDGAYVYFIDKDSVYRADRTGGTAQVLAPLAPASGTIFDLLSDGEHLYFADKHAVYRLPVTGGTVEPLTYGWNSLRAIAVDDSTLYFTDQAGGLVLKRPK